MKGTTFVLAVLTFSTKFARSDPAIHDSLTNSLVPTRVRCPADMGVRRPSLPNPVLGAAESNYVLKRSQGSGSVWTEYLDNVGIPGFDVVNFVAKGLQAGGKPGFDLPNIALAISGGGERAVMVGGGIMSGFDNRNSTAMSAKTGGVLQIANYMVGLSGGSWLVGSYVLASCPTFEALRDTVWKLSLSLLSGNAGDLLGTIAGAVSSGAAKLFAFYPVSLVDGFGTVIGGRYVNDSNVINGKPPLYGIATLWTSIIETPAYKAFTAPFPIILAIGRVPPNIGVDTTSPSYEITATDFGTYDPSLEGGAFIPIKYLGTTFMNGTLDSLFPDTPCTVGFDNAGFMMASSGTAFGDPASIFLESIPLFNNGLSSALLSFIPDYILTTARIPSPFQRLAVSTYKSTYLPELNLIDGGLAGENVPVFPLLVPERHVDVVIILDASSDTGDFYNGFPDGASIVATYVKSFLPGYKRFVSPALPTVETIIARGYNKRPTFFGGSGCNSSAPASPMYVYLANTDLVYNTGTSTFIFDYSPEEQAGFFQNGFAIATQSGIPPISPDLIPWSTCLACALLDAQIKRNSEPVPAICLSCFAHYCWDGTNGNGTAAQTAIGADDSVTPPLNSSIQSQPMINLQGIYNGSQLSNSQNALLNSAGQKLSQEGPAACFLGIFCPQNTTQTGPSTIPALPKPIASLNCPFGISLFCSDQNSTNPLPPSPPPQNSTCNSLFGIFCPFASSPPSNTSNSAQTIRGSAPATNGTRDCGIFGCGPVKKRLVPF